MKIHFFAIFLAVPTIQLMAYLWSLMVLVATESAKFLAALVESFEGASPEDDIQLDHREFARSVNRNLVVRPNHCYRFPPTFLSGRITRLEQLT